MCHAYSLYREGENVGAKFDAAYRTFLHSYSHREGFDVTRLYVDLFSGGSYSTTPCFYCGLQATCEDHSYPLMALSQLLAEGQPPAKRQLTIVPSCHECNGILADHLFPNQSARKRFIKKRLRQKYQRIFTLPTWEEAEIRELGTTLQVYVRQGVDLKKLLNERLWWYMETSVQPIALELKDRTFLYRQIERHGNIALYCQEHKESHVQRFEVIRIRIQKAHTWPNGETTPDHESYPGSHAWGRDGWTFFTLDAARTFVATLIQASDEVGV
jgi:hypothetical protein